MYLKSSGEGNGSSILQSPWINLPHRHSNRRSKQRGIACVSFWYFLHSGHSTSLSVNVQQDGSNKRVWRRVGDLGNEWNQAQFHVNATPQFKVPYRSKKVGLNKKSVQRKSRL